MSNLADSDLLTDDLVADGVEDRVAGISGYVSAAWKDRLLFMAEYVGALSEFGENDMDLVGGRRPEAWGTELVWAFPEGYGLGVRYERTDDAGDLLPEYRYGAIAYMQPFPGGYLGLEVMRESFYDGEDATAVTAKLAYTF